MNPYNLSDEEVLSKQGWECKAKGTYKGYTKDDLIGEIECLTHNWAGAEKGLMLMSYRLEQFAKYLDNCGYPQLFSQICATPEERASFNYPHIIPKLGYFCRDRNDYWYKSWQRSQNTIKFLKEAIEDIKSYSPHTYDLDYDYDEEPVDNWYPLDIDEIVYNIFMSNQIDNETDNEMLYKREYLGEFPSLDYFQHFDEEAQKAEQEAIKRMAVEPKENFFDYYDDKGDKDKNEQI